MTDRWIEPFDMRGVRARRDAKSERFEALFRHNFSVMVRALSCVAFDQQTAEDAVQDAFLRLYALWEVVQNPEEAQPWLYQTALNRLLDQRRAAARRQRMLPALVARLNLAKTSAWPEAESSVIAALRRLPLRQRTAVALFYLADLSVSEVAAVMGISEESVNQHLNRARSALRRHLKEEL